MNKKNLAKTVTIAVLSVLLIAIIITIICLSTISKDYGFGFNKPYRLEISVDQNGNQVLTKNSEQYSKIMDLYNESFKTSTMSALFSGKAFDSKEFKEEINSVSTITNNGYCLVFKYDTKQTLNEKTTYSKEYDTIYIQVLDSEDFSLINAYLVNSSNSSSYYKYSTYASQSNLYSYLEENFAK